MFILTKSGTSAKTGYVGSKTRSLGQILEKVCVCCKVHIFSSIIMKRNKNVCLDKISDDGSCRVKTRSLGEILEKPCVRSRGHIFSQIIKKLGQNFCCDEISEGYKILR